MAAHSFLVSKSGNQGGIGAAVKVTYDIVDFDIGGGWDPTNNRWIVGPGLYMVGVGFNLSNISNLNAQTDSQIRVGSGGSAIYVDRRYNAVATTGSVWVTFSGVWLNTQATENFEAWVGVSVGTLSVSGAPTYFWGIKLG